MKKRASEGMGRVFSMNFIMIAAFVSTALLFAPSASADSFTVKDVGGAALFNVTDAGNVGIATGSPWAVFHVAEKNGQNPTRGIISSQHYDGPSAAVMQFERSRGTLSIQTTLQNGDSIGAFHFQAFDGTAYQPVATVKAVVNGTVQAGSVPGDLWFHAGSNSSTTWPNPKMVLTSAGRVGIGTSSPVHLIQLSNGAYSDGAVWADASSRELKENIRDLSTEEANKTLQELNPVKYNYKTDKEDKHVGFIAEDVPDLVATKDRKGLSPMDIVAVLTKVVQEKSQVIDRQQSTIDELAATVTQMKAKIQRLESMNISARAEER